MIIPPDVYLEGVCCLCDPYNILLIVDEVMSGFGRTGKSFAVGHWMVMPDIITMAKGLTSGYPPLETIAMRSKIAEFFKDRVYQGGLTYNAHPVSLAAVIANIQTMQEDGLVEPTAMLEPIFLGMLNDLGEKHNCVGEVNSIGLFGVLELDCNR